MLNLLLAVNTEALKKSFEILWQGLLAIVVVVGIIIAVTYFMKYVAMKIDNKNKGDSDKSKENEEEN